VCYFKYEFETKFHIYGFERFVIMCAFKTLFHVSIFECMNVRICNLVSYIQIWKFYTNVHICNLFLCYTQSLSTNYHSCQESFIILQSFYYYHRLIDIISIIMASTDAVATSSSAMTTSDSNGKVSQTQTQYFSCMSTAAIQDLIDGGVENMSKPWTGSVKFKFHVCRSYDMTNLPAIFNAPPEKLDICDFIGGKDPLALVTRLYFCPTTYTPPASDNISRDHTGWIDLKRDIEKAGHEGGNVIVSNGGKVGLRVFKCGQCYRNVRKSRAQDITAENPMRETSLVNDKKTVGGPLGEMDPKE